MSMLSELNTMMGTLSIPVETGVFSSKAPDEYVVITPLAESCFYADDRPALEIQEARLSLFSKGNYLKRKRQIVAALVDADFTITDRRYVGHEDDTDYHHYSVDVLKEYEI